MDILSNADCICGSKKKYKKCCMHLKMWVLGSEAGSFISATEESPFHKLFVFSTKDRAASFLAAYPLLRSCRIECHAPLPFINRYLFHAIADQVQGISVDSETVSGEVYQPFWKPGDRIQNPCLEFTVDVPHKMFLYTDHPHIDEDWFKDHPERSFRVRSPTMDELTDPNCTENDTLLIVRLGNIRSYIRIISPEDGDMFFWEDRAKLWSAAYARIDTKTIRLWNILCRSIFRKNKVDGHQFEVVRRSSKGEFAHITGE